MCLVPNITNVCDFVTGKFKNQADKFSGFKISNSIGLNRSLIPRLASQSMIH